MSNTNLTLRVDNARIDLLVVQKQLKQLLPSRQLSLAQTKLEEALLWLGEVRKQFADDPGTEQA